MPFDPNRIWTTPHTRVQPIPASEIGDGGTTTANVQQFLDARRNFLGVLANQAARDALTGLNDGDWVILKDDGAGKPRLDVYKASGTTWSSIGLNGNVDAYTLRTYAPSQTAGTANTVVVRGADGSIADFANAATRTNPIAWLPDIATLKAKTGMSDTDSYGVEGWGVYVFDVSYTGPCDDEGAVSPNSGAGGGSWRLQLAHPDAIWSYVSPSISEAQSTADDARTILGPLLGIYSATVDLSAKATDTSSGWSTPFTVAVSDAKVGDQIIVVPPARYTAQPGALIEARCLSDGVITVYMAVPGATMATVPAGTWRFTMLRF